MLTTKNTKKTLDRVIVQTKALASLYRSISRAIKTNKFKHLYDQASDDDKKKVMVLIETLNYERIKIWCKTQEEKHEDYGEMTYRQLQKIAKKVGVKNYSRKNKLELIRELSND